MRIVRQLDRIMNCPRPDQIPPFPGAEIHPHLRSAHHQEMMTKFDPMGEKAVTWQVEYGFQATLTLLGT